VEARSSLVMTCGVPFDMKNVENMLIKGRGISKTDNNLSIPEAGAYSEP